VEWNPFKARIKAPTKFDFVTCGVKNLDFWTVRPLIPTPLSLETPYTFTAQLPDACDSPEYPTCLHR
jgi:hypothetical protein